MYRNHASCLFNDFLRTLAQRFALCDADVAVDVTPMCSSTWSHSVVINKHRHRYGNVLSHSANRWHHSRRVCKSKSLRNLLFLILHSAEVITKELVVCKNGYPIFLIVVYVNGIKLFVNLRVTQFIVFNTLFCRCHYERVSRI